MSDGVQIVQQLKVTSTKKAVDMQMIGSDVVRWHKSIYQYAINEEL